ncbi:hypothetical protein ABEX08_13500 [Priestia megaterium]
MNRFTTDLVQALVQKEAVTEIFRSHLETAVKTLLSVVKIFLLTKNPSLLSQDMDFFIYIYFVLPI